jgi:tryptophanyl-tRNA synthetase
MRVLSGIQPTGRFHWGNYFGAIRQYIDLQHENQGYYFIADLHALNTVRDKKELQGYVWDAALDLLALGLDPNKATLFVQSDVPEVSQLCWLLMTGTPMGLLERCHAYKDKKAKGLNASAGLFTYPVLMAADILAYDANWVPVGEDQLQHIEVCRDLAKSFNAHYGDVFVMPEGKVVEGAAKVPGLDGEKMSKSYNNTLAIFEDPKAQRKQIMRIATDSRPMDQPKEPNGDTLFDLLKLVAKPTEIEEVAAIYRRGGFGYGDIKKRLADAAESYFATARSKRAELEANPDWVLSVLEGGAQSAREVACKVLARVQEACGTKRGPSK